MKIPLNGNLAVAEKVRHAINRLNKHRALVERCHFECFDNCREQGYVLKVFVFAKAQIICLAFSENRNSDEIVVYCYTNTAFPTNLPAKDTDWQDKRYFRYDEVEGAARYIIKRAKEFLT
jgi:hypothetical protein